MRWSIFSRQMIGDLAKPWLGPLFSLALLILLGAFGYRLTEGWDWGDCFWMVVITISTIGFGEVETLSSLGRVVTVLIIGGGLVVVQLTLKRLLLLFESGYFRKMRELRFRRLLRNMKDHVILCGYGRIGKEIAEQLQDEGVPTLIVELDPVQQLAAEERELKVLLADATLDETLLSAGIEHCLSLVEYLEHTKERIHFQSVLIL